MRFLSSYYFYIKFLIFLTRISYRTFYINASDFPCLYTYYISLMFYFSSSIVCLLNYWFFFFMSIFNFTYCPNHCLVCVECTYIFQFIYICKFFNTDFLFLKFFSVLFYRQVILPINNFQYVIWAVLFFSFSSFVPTHFCFCIGIFIFLRLS